MKILFLSYYYKPDLSAGAFRSTNLVQALLSLPQREVHVDVLASMPNRYGSFKVPIPQQERSDRYAVSRTLVAAHAGGFVAQARCYRPYAAAVLKHAKVHDYDLVYATSSRLMTAVLGARVARMKKIPLYLDIRDIFVDTIGDVLPGLLGRAVAAMFRPLEGYALRTASTVNLVSPGFEDYFRRRYPNLRYTFFTNGIDPEFIEASRESLAETAERRGDEPRRRGRPLRVVYAGNIGDGQGLHLVIPELARRLGDRATFVVIGDGGRKLDLQRAVAIAGCGNVEILPPVPRDQLITAYNGADVLFLHLNDYPAFTRVLPSKIFEYAAMGKPVWAGVAGYAARFVREKLTNSAVFLPCDPEAGIAALEALSLSQTDRSEFVGRFARTAICHAMAEDILSQAKPSFTRGPNGD
jgi:glycosyltransferase involved in cell wall biosynthesis